MSEEKEREEQIKEKETVHIRTEYVDKQLPTIVYEHRYATSTTEGGEVKLAVSSQNVLEAYKVFKKVADKFDPQVVDRTYEVEDKEDD